MQETWVWSHGWEDSLEKRMTIQSSILGWKIQWTEEPGRLQSMGCKELDTTEQQSNQCMHAEWYVLHSTNRRKNKQTKNPLLVWAIPSSPSLFMINVYFLLCLYFHSGLAKGKWVARDSASHCSYSGTQVGGTSTIWTVLATVEETEIIN